MGTWFWLNIPLALLFVCRWAGIPLWLTRWRAELSAKHAELAAELAPRRSSHSRIPQSRTRPAAPPMPELLTRWAAKPPGSASLRPA